MRNGLSYSALKKIRKRKMTDHLQQALFSDFEEAFKARTTKTGLLLDRCSIACGDGWEGVIRHMCEVLKNKPTTVLQKKSLSSSVLTTIDVVCRKIESVFRLNSYSLYKFKPTEYLDFPGFFVRFEKIKESYGMLNVSYSVVSRLKHQDLKKFNKKDILSELLEYRGFAAGVISAAESRSLTTCENDGDLGELYTKGWWKTLCPCCAKKM